jgi:Ca-activated chloride channel family protein
VQVRSANAGDGASGNTGVSRVVTRQVAPGRYEATVMADATQPITITLDGAEGDPAAGGVTSGTVLPDIAAEYRFRAADETLLRSIASATGGSWQPTALSLANATSDSRTARRPLWPALIALALALWFVDLLLRRVRIFEPAMER